MSRAPHRTDHPAISYVIGSIVILIQVTVIVGIIYHLGFSSHGPGLLRPLVNIYNKKHTPAKVKTVRRYSTSEIHEHFHQFVDYPEIPENEQSTCFICHSTLPHSKTKKIRAMLNMHTNFFACETCHLKISEGEAIEYQWYSPREKNAKGPFFGTFYDPETGELQCVHNQVAKITPFYNKDGVLTPTRHMERMAMARDYMRVRDPLTPEQRKEVTKKFHVDIRPKGPECQTCHSSKGLLDFKKLQFSEKRIVDLENLSIKGIITKYDKFYIPDLFIQSDVSGSSGQGLK